jgi:hypothetical protein
MTRPGGMGVRSLGALRCVPVPAFFALIFPFSAVPRQSVESRLAAWRANAGKPLPRPPSHLSKEAKHGRRLTDHHGPLLFATAYRPRKKACFRATGLTVLTAKKESFSAMSQAAC